MDLMANMESHFREHVEQQEVWVKLVEPNCWEGNSMEALMTSTPPAIYLG